MSNHHFPMVFPWYIYINPNKSPFSHGFPIQNDDFPYRILLNHNFPMVFLWFSIVFLGNCSSRLGFSRAPWEDSLMSACRWPGVTVTWRGWWCENQTKTIGKPWEDHMKIVIYWDLFGFIGIYWHLYRYINIMVDFHLHVGIKHHKTILKPWLYDWLLVWNMKIIGKPTRKMVIYWDLASDIDIWWFSWNMTGLFVHILEILFPIDFHIFRRGWNHQPDGMVYPVVMRER